jgi:hypothetical protein
MTSNYFELLSIPIDASDMDIKRAYRTKAKEFHPANNKDPKAFENFIKVNEAYEILIHHNTRELYLEDMNSYHDPTEYKIYSYWINEAHERAREFSVMSYEGFINTKFYKETHTTPYFVFWIGIFIGISLLVIPYILLMNYQFTVVGILMIFILLPLGVFLIIQSLTGIQAVRRFH